MKRMALAAVVAVVTMAALSTLAVFTLNRTDESPAATGPGDATRGAYLAQAGHCAGCHTARGGAAYAGGRALTTPFGTVYSANLTPDAQTGIGRWSDTDFWRALHNGRAADGRWLLPACPYPNFTQVSRDDVRDLFAYLRSLPAVRHANRAHELRAIYGTQAALAVWRALHFRPGAPPADRGAYLVSGLGHCSACHGRRNAWAATDGPLDLRGGAVVTSGWYAPALDDPREAGVAEWPQADVVALLQSGRNAHANASGPMAGVVAGSTQHLADADLQAVATYLRALPQRRSPPPAQATTTTTATTPATRRDERGAKRYEEHCAACHGDQGQGSAGVAPALRGNRAVVMDRPDNLIRVVLGGGYGPATAANPRPHGMPPYAVALSNDDVAAVVTHIRSAWGHTAAAVDTLAVDRQRGGTAQR
jgi:mono/diheme cytochrome c family protein